MPNGQWDDKPVTWGRYNEAQTNVQRRLDSLGETIGSQGARVESTERTIDTVKERVDRFSSQFDERRKRTWSLGTILLASLLLPLLVTAISIWAHLRLS
jgi:hypothetical protein